MRPAVRSVLQHGALLALGIVLALVTLEVALRATGWVFLRMRQTAEPVFVERADAYRVLCLGESTTADISFQARGKSYPFHLQQILNRDASGMTFKVINGGVPATTSDAIVKNLPARLDRDKPDIVVAMMGINDGESSDPVFQVSGHLRVWKLAKMLYYSWWKPQESTLIVGANAPAPLIMSGAAAWEQIIARANDEAERLLRPLLNQDESLTAKARANGMMAVLNWQRGDDAEAERYHQRFLEIERALPHALTIRSYRELRRILAERGIPLVAVQYPGLPVDMLRETIESQPDVVLVDNEQTFVQLLKDHPTREVFRDLFGGIFGHMTPYANGVLAANVAQGVLRVVATHPAAP